MISAQQIDRDVAGDHVLMLRGVAGLTVLLLIAAVLTAVGKGAFSDNIEVSAMIDNAGGSLTPGSDVKSRGVILGRVDAIEPADSGVRIVMTLDGEKSATIPESSTARVLPAAVFGTAFVDLVPAGNGHPLRHGSVVRQATDGKTLELQDALDNTDRVLSAIDPAELASTLAAVGSALDGRGRQIGETIDAADSYLAKLEPEMPLVREVLGQSSTALHVLDEVAPELLAGFEDSRPVMRTIRDKREAINESLVLSDRLVRTGDRFLRAERVRIARVVDRLAIAFDALYDFRAGFPTGFTAFADFAEIAARGLTKGPWLDTDAYLGSETQIKLGGKVDYTPADCPRYGPVHGDNCGDN